MRVFVAALFVVGSLVTAQAAHYHHYQYHHRIVVHDHSIDAGHIVAIQPDVRARCFVAVAWVFGCSAIRCAVMAGRRLVSVSARDSGSWHRCDLWSVPRRIYRSGVWGRNGVALRFRDGKTQVANKDAFHRLNVFPVVVNGLPWIAKGQNRLQSNMNGCVL